MKSYILTPLLALALVVPIHGSPLLSENFDSLSVGGLNGQSGWSAKTGVSVISGGQSYTNGAITINGGANSVQSNVISSTTADFLATKGFSSQSGEVWFSFTLQVGGTTDNPRYWFWVSTTTDLNTGFHGSITDNNSGSKNFFAEARNNTTGTTGSSTTIPTENQVYFLVARLSKDGAVATNASAYDKMEIWVDPSSTSLSAATLSVDGPAAASFTGGIANFGLTALTTATTLQWDNLLVGTSQADVLNVYAVPEPSTYALLGGLAALGFVSIRRRRQN